MKPTLSQPAFSFDVGSLKSDTLTQLLHEAETHVQNVNIEMIREETCHQKKEAHPAYTIGVDVHHPTIRFVDSLNRQERIEAIAHELTHLLLLYRSGIRLIHRRRPRPGDFDGICKYFMNMHRDWFYLLGQICNTTHHLFLIDYLKEERGIESEVHLRLLRHNFYILAEEECDDIESRYAKGIIAYEYEKLIGRADQVGEWVKSPCCRMAYESANRHFGAYRWVNLPTPSEHEENILSFLTDLGYEREDFAFVP